MIFKPGLLPREQRMRKRLLSAPKAYRPPLHIDTRTELLSSSNQLSSSACVGFSLAGWLEYYRWKYYGIAEQIDGNKIYEYAKTIDGYPNLEGTTLEAGLQAIQDLKLFHSVFQIRSVSTRLEVKQALHRYGVVIGAFDATDKWMTPSADGWMQPNGKFLGGHACLLCGFSDIEKPNYFSLQNSWGEIGWRGFMRMSPEQFDREFDYGLVWDWNGEQ